MSTVRDDPAAGRFVLDVDGATAFAAYRRDGDRLIFTHTEVPDALSGQGIGGRLVQGALDLARADGRRVVPRCSFVRHFIETHADYAEWWMVGTDGADVDAAFACFYLPSCGDHVPAFVRAFKTGTARRLGGFHGLDLSRFCGSV